MIVPPFSGVRLVEYRDRIELAPIYRYREFVGLGKRKASEVGPPQDHPARPFFDTAMGEGDLWVIVQWRQYENGQEEAVNCQMLDSEATEAEAIKAFESMGKFVEMTKKELPKLRELFEPKGEDIDYIERRFPNEANQAEGSSIDESDLYRARLKVLAGMQPNTAAMMEEAFVTKDKAKRQEIERRAVQAYFADLARHWSEEMILAWQRNNPVGTEWMIEFARISQGPILELDSVKHKLVLNWLRRNYNLLTADELSDAIFEITGKRVKPEAIKKRRERLGLTSKRPPGPPPANSQ